VTERDEHEILTLEEVAGYLRLTPQTIYKWAQEKRIPAVKLGKEWRFRRSIIDRWLDDQMLGDDSGFEHLRDKESGPARPADPLKHRLGGDA
jgi:excisionase family DNA binding protein